MHDEDHDRFDKAYFDHWYRGEGFGSKARLDRKVDYALAAAEYLLERRVTSVLDVGCGEGEWQPALRKRRPHANYVGVDPSGYAVERFGAKRGLRRGRFGEIDEVVDESRRFDLVVCVDVLGYVPDDEVQRGLAAIAARLDGVALMEIYVDDDDIVGDLDHFVRRPAATYERWFAAAGLRRIGPHLYAGERLLPIFVNFEGPLA